MRGPGYTTFFHVLFCSLPRPPFFSFFGSTEAVQAKPRLGLRDLSSNGTGLAPPGRAQSTNGVASMVQGGPRAVRVKDRPKEWEPFVN